MEGQPATIPLFVSIIALLVSGLATIAGFRQARTSTQQARLVEHEARVRDLQALHAAQVRSLEERCARLEEDNERARLHIDRCEEELRRLHGAADHPGRRRTDG